MHAITPHPIAPKPSTQALSTTHVIAMSVCCRYCHKLSMLLSTEDVCKRKLMEKWYLGGGISRHNLTSAQWNANLGC